MVLASNALQAPGLSACYCATDACRPLTALALAGDRTGTDGLVWELSLRIMRKDAEAAGGVEVPLRTMASMCDQLTQHGWHVVPAEELVSEEAEEA